jgi:hypothetical protein
MGDQLKLSLIFQPLSPAKLKRRREEGLKNQDRTV